MQTALKQLWWVFLLRGIFSIIFGVIAILFPGIALITLITVFGIYAVVDGVSTIVGSLFGRKTDDQWWLALIEGIAGIIVGILVLTFPDISAIALLFVIAFWAVITGTMQIITAIRLRKVIENELWLGLGGLLSVIVGILLFRFPGAGALGLLIIIGAYAIAFGVTFIMLAFRIRNHVNKSGETTSSTSATGATHP